MIYVYQPSSPSSSDFSAIVSPRVAIVERSFEFGGSVMDG